MKGILWFGLLLVNVNIFSQGVVQLDTSAINISVVLVEGGSFKMGSENGEKNERPVHMVTLNSFYIGKYEVTQRQWHAVMKNDLRKYKECNECPIIDVTNEDIDAFLDRLNKISGKLYRLPTEAEWEYAALGGNKSLGYRYSGSNNLTEVAWYKANAESKAHPVGEKKPNELGIYDMSGNVWEICSDWYDPGYYAQKPEINPRNGTKALHRVVRGGSWRSGGERCYSKARNRNISDHKRGNGGFRLVLDR